MEQVQEELSRPLFLTTLSALPSTMSWHHILNKMENGFLKHWKCLEQGFWNHNSSPKPLEQILKNIKEEGGKWPRVTKNINELHLRMNKNK